MGGPVGIAGPGPFHCQALPSDFFFLFNGFYFFPLQLVYCVVNFLLHCKVIQSHIHIYILLLTLLCSIISDQIQFPVPYSRISLLIYSKGNSLPPLTRVLTLAQQICLALPLNVSGALIWLLKLLFVVHLFLFFHSRRQLPLSRLPRSPQQSLTVC